MNSMSNVLSYTRRKVYGIFGEDAFSWFDRSYVLDWTIATIASFIALWIKELPPYEREFDINDPLIQHAHHKNQISGSMNKFIALSVPSVVVLVVGMLRLSAMHIHHGLLSLWTGSAFTALITEILKNRVGRLRPDFLSRCKWRNSLKACSGKIEDILDGRRSFPSGHSSTVWSGMTFLTLFLAGATGAWCLSRAAPARSLLSSKMARLCLTFSPIAFATWVAVSRVEDYRHHKEDVIVGSLIGFFTAATCYLIYWPNPFTSQGPRYVYNRLVTDRPEGNYEYELAGIEHADGTV